MKNKKILAIDRRGFGTIEVILVLVLLGSLTAIGYFISKDHAVSMENCGNPLKVTTPGIQNDIVIDCPANNAKVGRDFTITGTAHYQGSNSYQNVSVSMDGMSDSPYLTNTGTKTLGPDGKFHLTYRSVPPGRHTFVVNISSGSKCNPFCSALISLDSSATLTLYVQ